MCQQVSLVGHSAGAQMCAMALLHRAKALTKHKQSHQNKAKSGQANWQDSQLPADVRMPANFIGMLLRPACAVEGALFLFMLQLRAWDLSLTKEIISVIKINFAGLVLSWE